MTASHGEVARMSPRGRHRAPRGPSRRLLERGDLRLDVGSGRRLVGGLDPVRAGRLFPRVIAGGLPHERCELSGPRDARPHLQDRRQSTGQHSERAQRRRRRRLPHHLAQMRDLGGHHTVAWQRAPEEPLRMQAGDKVAATSPGWTAYDQRSWLQHDATFGRGEGRRHVGRGEGLATGLRKADVDEHVSPPEAGLKRRR